MIQDIYPNTFSNKYSPSSTLKEDDYIFHFKGNSLLLKQEGDQYYFPKKKDLEKLDYEKIFLFTLNKSSCFLVWDCNVKNDAKYNYHEINFLRNLAQKEMDWAGVVAFQLMTWYSQNRYCGKCGSPTGLKNDERAIICKKCDMIVFPNIAPAIIVAILCGDKILLAQGNNFQTGLYSLLAGYADIGESIEDTVYREVKEEVGIDIRNVRYYKSQPWPYSSSMMLGFIAEADDSQPLILDKTEIAEAGWFTRNNLPNYPPDRSIAGEIINRFIKGDL